MSKQKSSAKQNILRKIKEYGTQKVAKLGQMWHLAYSFRKHSAMPAIETTPWTLAQKVRQNHIAERRNLFHQAGGQKASLIRYGLKKARRTE